MRLLILSFLMLFANFAYASAILGTVKKCDGIVKVKHESSFKKSNLKVGYEIKGGDLISTSRDSKVLLKLSDGSNVILSSNSSINFKDAYHAEQMSGKIFYKITSRDAKNSLKIKTPFAIIGIKGTTFVVNANKGKESVALKEGLIGVTSIKEQFNLYRKKVLAEYNDYTKKEMNAFKKFKNATKKPEPEKTKEFDLQHGNRVSFSGNTVKESDFNKKTEDEFAEFEKEMNAK